MATTKQRTQTDFLCLTISAGAGIRETTADVGSRYMYRVSVRSDATDASIRFDYHDSADRHDKGIDQLDRENLLYAFRAFTDDAATGDQSFADFCADLGLDPDSRSEEALHRRCQASARKFRRLFHDDREPAFVLNMLASEGIE